MCFDTIGNNLQNAVMYNKYNLALSGLRRLFSTFVYAQKKAIFLLDPFTS